MQERERGCWHDSPRQAVLSSKSVHFTGGWNSTQQPLEPVLHARLPAKHEARFDLNTPPMETCWVYPAEESRQHVPVFDLDDLLPDTCV